MTLHLSLSPGCFHGPINRGASASDTQTNIKQTNKQVPQTEGKQTKQKAQGQMTHEVTVWNDLAGNEVLSNAR